MIATIRIVTWSRYQENKFLEVKASIPIRLFFVLVYNSKKKLVASYDREFIKTFENGEYTVVTSPRDENGLCYRNVDRYKVSINCTLIALSDNTAVDQYANNRAEQSH